MTLHLPPLVIIFTILCTAFASLLSHMALAVFNDGVRPFLLDFHQGELKRPQMSSIAFGLSAGFIFGLGVPIAFSSSVLNPWLLFLPSDILGIISPKKWLAPILGAAWGAIVVFSLGAVTSAATSLPVNFLDAMQQMSTPILYLFAFFPSVAIAMQFGKLRGSIAAIISFAVMLVIMKWVPAINPGAAAMAAGMIILVIIAIFQEFKNRKEAKAEAGEEDAEDVEDETDSIFAANAKRLRKYLPMFMVMGALLAVLVNTHKFGGGEATSYLLAKGDYANAAQVDFYRALGFIPLVVTTAVASGAYQIVGSTLIYPIAYLLPNPILAAIVGALLFGLEVFVLSYLAKGLSKLSTVRDASDTIRNAITLTLEVAILFGSIAAGNAMAGGIGIAVVGGIYALNEAFGRPIVRMAAGPVGVIIAGILFNILAYAHLFTPLAAK
ncbi:uncharacterized protein YhfT [Thermosporothrix hazakensis]|jgi:hypothetical protein|uniref:Uncharacterized protein YhfT n=2 Tax=Thermosporothrix TaxID=768650 RepID=A0A326U2T9_THEHA|nr:YhfT family protein [Thermosporothrix hazakensis]PZW22956.1 uncharacterized protein YhfT [Thermosporothrix hazakensis]BBH90048.1 membrane protein [Thermosporothrix sp. COM3]GCE48269.1 membrane protein [Thermosporothrix hazakensis]